MKRKLVISLLLLTSLIGCSDNPTTQQTSKTSDTTTNAPPKTINIEYLLRNESKESSTSNGLSATLNGKQYDIIVPDKDNLTCIDIFYVQDYNDDGYIDVLMEDIIGCGGNCCPNEYFFCFYHPEKDTFIQTPNFGQSWEDPTIEHRKGRTTVKLVNEYNGMGDKEMKEVTAWFVLDQDTVWTIDSKERKPITAIKEIRASNISEEDEHQGITLNFDLNKDGKDDKIHAQYWLRWGSLQWEVILSTSPNPILSGSGKRIGILPTTTNGVHDLVNEFDQIYIWNGTEYKPKKEIVTTI